MDTTAEVLTFGNPDLPEGTPERPLVTFALFAYNQEQYVREAVEGAFSQTYSPLEIILSDDASSDRTFARMKELATDYDGAHRIKLNQNKKNLGICSHVDRVFRLANGEVIVMAAGDDISFPFRVEELVCALGRVDGALAAASNSIDYDTGRERICIPPQSLEDVLRWRGAIYGATAAYRRSVTSGFDTLKPRSMIEDGALALRVFLNGGQILKVDRPLLRVRASTGVSSQGASIRSFHSPPTRAQLSHRRMLFCQWRSDLRQRDLSRLLRVAFKTRLEVAYQHRLLNKKAYIRHTALCASKHLGLKRALFHFIAIRYPRLFYGYCTVKKALSEGPRIMLR